MTYYPEDAEAQTTEPTPALTPSTSEMLAVLHQFDAMVGIAEGFSSQPDAPLFTEVGTHPPLAPTASYLFVGTLLAPDEPELPPTQPLEDDEDLPPTQPVESLQGNSPTPFSTSP